MKFQALKPIYGDFGPRGKAIKLHRGDRVEIPDANLRMLKVSDLEAKGVLMRCVDRPAVNRKAYTVYQSKPAEPPQDKASQPEEIKPVAPEVIATVPLEDKRRGRRFRGR